MASGHRPVLYQEVLTALQPKQGNRYIDGTVGAGGHAWGILEASSPDGQLLGLDVDPQALTLARDRLSIYGLRVILVNGSYLTLRHQLEKLGWSSVNGILLDLGVSSMQLDTAERGFSFQFDAPLDMRFDPDNPLTAADLVNRLNETELAELIFRFGEDPQARRISRAIIQNRPIENTGQLAAVILQATGSRRRSSSKVGQDRKKTVHPATRTFQALRIAVNNELQTLEQTLPDAIQVLAPGGRLAVISFHSLEDRIVKQYFRRESQNCICPPRQPVCTCGHQAAIRELTHRPIQPKPEEIAQNPRSRSARLRVAEKLSVSD